MALRRDNACFEGVPIPANWEAFLRRNANKDELFRYLSDCIHACDTGRKVIISTKDETIVSTQNDMSDVERGSSVVECRTRNRESPGSNPL